MCLQQLPLQIFPFFSKFLLDFNFCRTRNRGVASLATRASLAAWSLNDNDTGNQVNSSTSGDASHVQANGQGMDSSFSFHYDISSLIYNSHNNKQKVCCLSEWKMVVISDFQ